MSEEEEDLDKETVGRQVSQIRKIERQKDKKTNIARIANAVQCHNFNCQVTKIVMNSGSQLSVL